ncbi:DUF5671 domain-containing protein [Paracoccus aerodenitrificans]|uniref:DUF5671 domain-containing protein n=1 Tax=Paracoccus aerodenitrificans TaxID=3017781 RepID=UPI0022F0031E|nr:DUF5671 domain-containing protein [Paracoccus aerodenitrificans]WBU62841.1 DUF5671 domain-containing protein [Paracoccus aerodenitrificans]
MQTTERLSDFVRQALLAGQSRDDIRHTLIRAGWSETDSERALSAWMDAGTMPPVPRPRPQESAREALFFGLLFITLAILAFHICALGFDIADILLPLPADPYGNAVPDMGFSMAALIGFTPVFLFLHRQVLRGDHQNPGRSPSSVRRWLASLILLITALTLLGDLVYVIYALLNGEITARFFAKAALVALMAALIFGYYRAELHD